MLKKQLKAKETELVLIKENAELKSIIKERDFDEERSNWLQEKNELVHNLESIEAEQLKTHNWLLK